MWKCLIISLLLLCTEVFAAKIQQQQIAQLLTDGAVLIDVRTPEEYRTGHIDKAINIPLAEIAEQNTQLLSLRDKKVVLYCRSGYRAGKASELLKALAFDDINHLDGDILGWQQAGLPLSK